MTSTADSATNTSYAHEILEAYDRAGNEVFHVFLGVAFVSFVAALLWSTIIAHTLREMSDWAQRIARAEQQLDDPLDLVCINDEYGDVFLSDGNDDDQVRPVPLSTYRL